MIIVEEAEVKIGVASEALWRALTKEFKYALPTNIPHLVKEVDILEGDGSFGTVYLIKLNSDAPNISFQKEKIVEFDELTHQLVIQVIEGGRLDVGFTLYKTRIKLNAIGDSETLINIKVDYETDRPELPPPVETITSAVAFIQSFETFIMKNG